jgi:hypothetical protein
MNHVLCIIIITLGSTLLSLTAVNVELGMWFVRQIEVIIFLSSIPDCIGHL